MSEYNLYYTKCLICGQPVYPSMPHACNVGLPITTTNIDSQFHLNPPITNNPLIVPSCLDAEAIKKVLLENCEGILKAFSASKAKPEEKILSLKEQDEQAGLVPLSKKEMNKAAPKPFPSRALNNFEPGVNPLMAPKTEW